MTAIALGAGGRAKALKGIFEYYVFLSPPLFFFFNKKLFIFMAFSFIARAGCKQPQGAPIVFGSKRPIGRVAAAGATRQLIKHGHKTTPALNSAGFLFSSQYY